MKELSQMCTMCFAVLQQADCSLTPSLAPSSEATTSLAATPVLQSSFQGSTSSEGADAAAGTNTSYEIAVGDRFDGELSSSSDSDWVEIQLEAGESYVFSVWGTNGSADGITDTAMSLYDENGIELEFNEDVFLGGQNYFSMIEYTASTSGTFYISVDSNYGDSGDYILQATTDVLTVEQVATQLTEFGWGIPTALNHDEQTGDTMTVNLTGLTAAGEQLALWALESWGEIMGMTFNTTTSTAADIVFDDDQAGAFAGPSSFNPNTGVINQAIVNVGTQWLVDYGTTYDSYSFLTYLHEIGHALGLTHSGNYNGSATFGVDNFFQNDSHQMTVMSYFGINEAGLGDNATAITPMIADVYSIWGLYGEPVSVNAGDTVWGANSNVSGTLGTVMGYLFDGDAVDENIFSGILPIAMTITDTGGYDIIDLSTVVFDQHIDLGEGGVSDIGGYNGNVVISLGTVIEEVIGGSGSDTVIGTIGDDLISGRAGDDSLSGGVGNDSLFGDQGNDWASGGDGDDSLNGALGDDMLFGDDGDDRILGQGGNDTLSGNKGNDRLFGGEGNDWASGGAGDDFVSGDDGDDSLFGEAGDDELIGGTGADAFDGGTHTAGIGDLVSYAQSDAAVAVNLGTGTGAGGHAAGDTLINVENLLGSVFSDTLSGGASDNVINGGWGDDTLFGAGGDDTLLGGLGDDYLIADLGADFLHGGSGGGDTADYSGSNSAVTVQLNNGGTIDGGFATGDIVWTENITGSDFADDITGTVKVNVLTGGDGDDRLNASSGSDTIYGGDGDDFIFGSRGADTITGGSNTGIGDTAAYSNSDARVIVDLDAGTATGSGHGTGDVLIEIENVFGSRYNDDIYGDNTANELSGYNGIDELFGRGGDDMLNGGGGVDYLNGGTGNDILSGGGGYDSFQFDTSAFGQDTITDFSNNRERMDMRGSGLVFEDLTIQQVNGDTVVTVTGTSNTITLENITTVINAEDFIF